MSRDPLLARLRALDAAAVSDAVDRTGARGGVAEGLLPLTSAARVAGRVLTVELVPADGEPAVHHLGARAIDAAGPDNVIVVANEGRTATACWGGTLSRGAIRAGVAGVVLDGSCRDLDEAHALGIGVWARGPAIRAARGRVRENATDVPVVIAGVRVEPGDYVIADVTGVVFVGADALSAVLVAAEQIVAREAAMAQAIDAGHPMTAVMGQSYEQLLEREARD